PKDDSPFTRRQVYSNNKTYFIIATAEDTYEKIAEEVQLNVDKIRKYNDLSSSKKHPEAGEVVFIETKGKANSTDSEHVVVAGETLQYIAQKHGVQLYYILKFNNLSEDSVITTGDKINLYMKKSK
ncbi:MAG: LysM peptidoglycan-binding domain-containing protein, partial [Bacteroidales bacterium]|nr:LysM peptidoglycan-binding domain-containing protein [Bacteroidales bacterium]